MHLSVVGYVLPVLLNWVNAQVKDASNSFRTSEFTLSSSSSRSSFSSPPHDPLPTYRFTGSRGQYLKFRPWYKSSDDVFLNGLESATLSFKFRTKKFDSFLLYMDDGGNSDFIVLTLDKGKVHVRLKFGEPAPIRLEIGSSLSDSRWHQVNLKLQMFTLTVTLDGSSVSGTISGRGKTFFLPLSYTYLGGLPSSFPLQRLTLPSAYFKDKFIGEMRRITMGNNVITHQEKKSVIAELPNPCSKYR